MKPKIIGKHIILLTEDYLKICNERNQFRQQVEDMFNGKRCEKFRLKAAEVDMLHDSIDKYKHMLNTLEEENERLKRIVRELCGEIVANTERIEEEIVYGRDED